MNCPECEYQSDSEHGLKIHYGKSHEGTLSGVSVDCANCGDTFRTDEYRLERSENLFCSTNCHDEWRAENVSGEDAGGWDGGKVTFECDWCGEESECWPSRLSNGNFCSDECLFKWRQEQMLEDNPLRGVTGEDHPAWKGGTDQSWRRQPKWRRTALKVYRRDNYTCQNCGESDTEIHAHHIVPVHSNGDKYDMGNLIALCSECHYEEHK